MRDTRTVSDLEFRVLGPVEAVREGDTLPLGGRQQQALLALLLLEPSRAVTVDRLVEELWHGHPPEGASTTLRAYVSRLRRALGEPTSITSSASGYALEVLPERVDAIQFERLTRAGQEALARGATRGAAVRLRSALALWRGRPFAGLPDEGALRLEAERIADLVRPGSGPAGPLTTARRPWEKGPSAPSPSLSRVGRGGPEPARRSRRSRRPGSRRRDRGRGQWRR